MITADILNETARRKGLVNREHIEKDYFQDLLLFSIYKKTNKLIFKGGTALYKFYSIPRFSEDLDFSVLEPVDVKNVIKEAVLATAGCTLKEIKEMKTSIIFKIEFKGILTASNRVRVDINIKNPVLAGFDVKTHISPYIDISPFSARVMKLEEIIAEKIHSLFAREKARDLYDLFFLLRLSSPDKALITAKLKNFNMTFNYNLIKKRIHEISFIWEKELKPFVLSELPGFKIVEGFVLDKLKEIR